MIQALFLSLIVVSAFYALVDWRKGVFLMILAGALQDPVRKMMPGAPGYMVLAFVPIWLAICTNVLFSGKSAWARFIGEAPSLVAGIQLMWFSLVLAFVVLMANYGTGAIAVGAIGLLGYAFPLLAIAVGYHYVREPGDLIRLIKFYCIVTALMLTGSLMEHWHLFPSWSALGTGVLGTTWIRHFPGYIVELTSGFYRSPDLMGWHAAMLVMLAFIMALRAGLLLPRVFWTGLMIWGAAMLLISGRNKMIFMPAICIAVFSLAQLYKGNVNRIMKVFAIGAASLGIFIVINTQVKVDEDYLLYTKKGSSEAVERLTQGGFWAVVGTYQQSGFFGEGLGTASTGARYGGNTEIRTWQESGLSKILVELGVVGLVAVFVFIYAIARSLWFLLNVVPRSSPEFILFAGLLGVLAANAASFIVSHQAFGDPYLVTFSGLFLGIMRSASRWLSEEAAPG